MTRRNTCDVCDNDYSHAPWCPGRGANDPMPVRDQTDAAMALGVCMARPGLSCGRMARFVVDGAPMCGHHKRQLLRRAGHGWSAVAPTVTKLKFGSQVAADTESETAA